MASGTITGSCNNSHYTLTCEWSSKANVGANTSSITAIVYLNGNGYSTSSSMWNCTIMGAVVTSGKSATIGGKTELGRRTWTVNHAQDGTCGVVISFSFGNGLSGGGTYTVSSGSGSGQVAMDVIPRVSTFTLSKDNIQMSGSDKFTVTINKASSAFTHTVVYTFGNIWSEVITKSTASTCDITPLLTDCKQIPNANWGRGRILVYTYNGNTEIGYNEKYITLNVPDNIVPKGSISVALVNGLSGKAVASKSQFKVTASNTAGNQGSTVQSVLLTGGDLNFNGTSATTGKLGSGSYTFSAKITDSRGRYHIVNSSVYTVYDYYAPKLDGYSITRCNASSVVTDDGTYALLKFKVNLKNIANANINAKQYMVEYKKTTDTTWITDKSWTTLSGYNVEISELVGSSSALIETVNSYDVRLSLKDSYTTTQINMVVNTMSCILDMEQNGVSIGAIHQGISKFEVNGRISAFGNGTRFDFCNDVDSAYIMYTGGTKALRLTNDDRLLYGGSEVLIRNMFGGSGKWWNTSTITPVGLSTSGVLEIGKYLDFHSTAGSTADYDGRLYLNGEIFEFTKDIKTYGAHFNVVQSYGEDLNLIPNKGASSVVSHGGLRPNDNGNKWLGSDSYMWHVVKSKNGVMTTSDERFKTKMGYTDIAECYQAAKELEIYNYIMLSQDKTKMKQNRYGQMAQEMAQEPENVHLGIMAQQLEQYECGKRAIVKRDVVDEETGEVVDYTLGVNPYDVNMIVLGALQQEIKIRDEQIANLEARLAALEAQVNKTES